MPTESSPVGSAVVDRRALRAVAVSFFVNGILISSLLPRYPQVAAQTGADEAAFGLALAGAGIGGLVGGLGAPLVARSAGVVRATALMGVLTAASVIAVALAPGVLALATALSLAGFADAGHDISMTEAALGEQSRRDRSIMGRLHGIWSVGSTGGGAVGAAMAGLGVPVGAHMAGVAVIAVALQLWAASRMRERTSVDANGRTGRAEVTPPAPGIAPASPRRIRLSGHGWLVVGGLVCATIATVLAEQSPQDWSALMLRRALDAPAGLAGMGPVVFSAGIRAGRAVVDPLIDRLGPRTVIRFGNGAAAVAMAVGLLAAGTTATAWPALVALAIAGAGVAGNFPLLFGAGDRIAATLGLPQGMGASIVGTAPRLGILVLPVVIGAVASAVGLIAAVGLTAVGSLLVAAVLPRIIAPREPTA